MHTGTLLADLLGKAGIDVTQESLKPLLGISIEMDDEIANTLQKNLFTLEAAKGNVTLKTHFVGNFAKGVDQDVNDLLTNSGRTDLLDLIKDIKGTGERVRTILTELNKPKTGDKDSDAAAKTLKEQVTQLNAQIAKEKTEREQEKTQLLNQFETERVQEKVLGKFNSLPWAESIPEAARPVLAQQFLSAALKESKAKIAKDESGNIQLLSEETGTSVFDSKNNIVTLEGLITNIMTENKFLKVAQGNEGGGTSAQHRSIPIDGGTATPNRLQAQLDRDYQRQAGL